MNFSRQTEMMRSILSRSNRSQIKKLLQNQSSPLGVQYSRRPLCLVCSHPHPSATSSNLASTSSTTSWIRSGSSSNTYLSPTSKSRSSTKPFWTAPRSISSKSAPLPTIELSPTKEPTIDLNQEDPDLFDVLNRIDRKVNLTERAIQKLSSLCEKESNSNLALRLAVEPGGCHGYQYNMKVVDIGLEGEDGMEEDDYLFSHRSPSKPNSPANLLIDSASLPLLNLSTLDYATELIGSQFVIKENPNAKGAGCGCGVSWEPKDDLLGSGSTTVEAEKSGPIKLDLGGGGGIDIGEKGRSSRLGPS